MPRIPVNQPYTITTTFGVKDPNAKHGYHAGIDLAVGIGTPVYASTSGQVTNSLGGPNTNQGIVVEIFDGKYYSHTFHLSRRDVSPGQMVTEGQLIGLSGNTGLSTGPHVHWGVGKVSWPASKSINDYIDPMEYIKEGGNMVGPVPVKITTTHQCRMIYESFGIYGVDNATLQAWCDNPDGTDYALMLGLAPQVKNNLTEQDKRLKAALAGGTTLAPGLYNVG